MTIEKLESEMQLALKNKNKIRRLVISEMIGAIQKAATSGKQRVEITESFVNETLQKVQKTYQEMIDTCPVERTELLESYKEQFEIVKEFTPQLVTDPEYIRTKIHGEVISTGLALTKKNRGAIMKLITPIAKGKMDMKVVSQVVGEMLQ